MDQSEHAHTASSPPTAVRSVLATEIDKTFGSDSIGRVSCVGHWHLL